MRTVPHSISPTPADSCLGPSSEFVSFTIPPPFSPRVRNALNASPHSVKLANLVGGLGMWYGFGRRLIGVYVFDWSRCCRGICTQADITTGSDDRAAQAR